MNIFSAIAKGIFSAEIKRQVREQMTIGEDEFLVGARNLSGNERDRNTYDREEVLQQALDAWRFNPLARRIVELSSQYVIGGGLTITCKHAETKKFLDEFWNHALNDMVIRIYQWCDELTRTGDLFLLMSTDAGGMSYFRALPSDQVTSVDQADKDIERELAINVKQEMTSETKAYAVYQPITDLIWDGSAFQTVAFHFSINRPVGASFGESDLAPLLKWLSRYSNWLEDRARLNRFRTAFLYVVTGKFTSDAQRQVRQAQLSAAPPNPGSILVTDENEKWDVLSAKLESSEANEDGLAIKKMIAAGAGIPLHFIAEPESATRTTAEAAGGPTYRKFEQRQEYFENMIRVILQAVVARRKMVDPKMDTKATIIIQGSDISFRDNVSLAMAASNIMGTLKDLRDRKLIDDAELLRMIYRFVGEQTDTEEMLNRGRTAVDPVLTGESAPAQASTGPGKQVGAGKGEEIKKQEIKVNPETGEENPGKE
jgi:hypothetical protein